jgi:dephospho-CoA kinase
MFRHGAKPVIGLIGGIGAGKTTAARCFANRGGFVIDADAIGHAALRQPGIVMKLVERWGERVRKPDGSLDRRAIGKIVFANPTERNALEELVFPYIGEGCRRQIAHAQNDPTAKFVVLDAAVMLEAGWNKEVDRIVYVDAPRDVRLARLAARSGWTEAELTAREAAQWPEDVKKSRADAVIVNAAGPEELQKQVDQLLREWGSLPVQSIEIRGQKTEDRD